jgi:hypothetical protein
LIEKDGPDTCNHMVHKSVDGIPCVRDRTDFCCKFSFLSADLVVIINYVAHDYSRFVWRGGYS